MRSRRPGTLGSRGRLQVGAFVPGRSRFASGRPGCSLRAETAGGASPVEGSLQGGPLRKPCFQVQTTIDDREKADRLVRAAVEKRLAACGQVLGPIASTYWWNGHLETEKEWMCVFKTTKSRASKLEGFLLEAHPYEVPEIVGFEIGLASRDYSEWIHDETED